MLGAVLLQIFARDFLKYPLPWTLGTCQLLFIYISFLGAVLVHGSNSHISIDLLVNKMPEGVKKHLRSLVTLAIEFVLTFWIYTLYQLLIRARGVYPNPAISIQFYYLPILIAAIFCWIYTAIDLFKLLKQMTKKKLVPRSLES